MSKRFTKISLTILTLVFAFCMSIAMLGVGNAYASNEVTTFEMASAVQVRQSGPNGIRFAATMNEYDYDKLRDVDGIEFGIILVPTDWIDSVDDLRFGNPDLPEYDEENPAQKYFAKGVNTPVIDLNDYDDDGDETEYVLCASFINIKESNFARGFTAKAYYKIGNEYFYAKGYSQKNIFEVASKHLATAEFEEDIPAQKAVKDYLVDVVDSVTEKYSETQLNVDESVIQDNVAYRGDALTATATVKNPSNNKTLTAGVKLVLMKLDQEVENGVAYDSENKKFVLATSGVFKLAAKLGSKIDNESAVDLTVKRRDVEVKVTTRRATTNYKTFEPIADQTQVLSTYAGYNKVDAAGNSVNLLYEVTDPENPTASISNANAELINNELGNWQLKVAENFNYLMWMGGYPVKRVVTYRANYVDNYGITYSYELPCSAPPTPVSDAFFGKDQTYFTATDALFTTITGAKALTIQNVPLTDLSTESIIKFTLVSYDGTTGEIKEATKSYQITISETGNPNNYVTIGFGRYSTTHLCFGVNAPCFGVTTHYGQRSQNETALNTAAAKLGSEPSDASGSGHMFDNYLFLKALRGQNAYNHDATNYNLEMLGFSIINNEFYVNAGWSDLTYKSWSILTKNQQELQTAIAQAFDGFTDVENVDVSINYWYNNTSNNKTLTKVIITELGGQPVTSQNANSWIEKAYYSNSTAPILYVD